MHTLLHNKFQDSFTLPNRWKLHLLRGPSFPLLSAPINHHYTLGSKSLNTSDASCGQSQEFVGQLLCLTQCPSSRLHRTGADRQEWSGSLPTPPDGPLPFLFALAHLPVLVLSLPNTSTLSVNLYLQAGLRRKIWASLHPQLNRHAWLRLCSCLCLWVSVPLAQCCTTFCTLCLFMGREHSRS